MGSEVEMLLMMVVRGRVEKTELEDMTVHSNRRFGIATDVASDMGPWKFFLLEMLVWEIVSLAARSIFLWTHDGG